MSHCPKSSADKRIGHAEVGISEGPPEADGISNESLGLQE